MGKIMSSTRRDLNYIAERPRRIIIKLVAQLFLSLLLLQLVAMPVFSREIIDMSGRKVIIPETITRVVGISPPATYLLYAVDPTLIGGLNFPPWDSEKKYMVEDYSNLPVIGGFFGQGRILNTEVLLRVKPDFLLFWAWKDDATNQKFEATMSQFEFPRGTVCLDSIENYPEALLFLGEVLKRKKRAERLYKYAAEAVNEAKSVAADIGDKIKIRVYYAEGIDGLSTEREGSVHAELIPLAGGINVHKSEAMTHCGMEKVSMEQVLLYAPEVILVKEKSFFDRIYDDPRWQSIPAVCEKRVYMIPHTPFNWFDRPPSFMRLLGVKWLLNILYPDSYPIDMVAETRTFYKLFLGVELNKRMALEVLQQ